MMVSVPDLGPAVTGVKVISKVQLSPSATSFPQLLPAKAKSPVTPTLDKCRMSPPVLLRITSCEALVVVTRKSPKLKWPSKE